MNPLIRSILAPVAIALLSALPAHAAATLNALFSEHAVLQRQVDLPVWGTADPYETVVIRILGREGIATAGEDGRWRVTLPPLPACSIPTSITVTDSTGSRQIGDIRVGDVWLCGGQSNMEWPLRLSNNADAEIAAASYPNIRHIKIAHRIARDPIDTFSGEWQETTPESAPHFTAVGYFFARQVHTELDVPIGLINSNWGGTPVESWLPRTAMDDLDTRVASASHQARSYTNIANNLASYQTRLAAWKGDPEQEESGKPNAPWTPGAENTALVLNHGMIAPLAPFAMRGVIWYQGEGNGDQPATYHTLFPALIQSWRDQFQQPELPFYWAQLASWGGGGSDNLDWGFLREAQHAALQLPHTGQAILLDVGDEDDIHPRNKQAVGDRLARVALAGTYGREVDYRGPTVSSVAVSGETATITFAHAAGLHTSDDTAPRAFEIAGISGEFHPADATLRDDVVTLTADAVSAPQYVRYAWRRFNDVNLANAAGLPAEPFRTDDFPQP